MTTSIEQARSRVWLTPVWLVEIELKNSGPVLYFSDRNIEVDGQLYEDYLESLSNLGEQVRRSDSKALNTNLQLYFKNRKYQSYNYLIEIGDTYPFEGAEITVKEVYLDVNGTTPSVADTLFKGILDAPRDIGLAKFSCIVSSTEFAKNRMWQDEVINTIEFPNAFDDIGKVIPIIYGNNILIPALWVDRGARTMLVSSITDTATSGITLSDSTGEVRTPAFPSSGTVMIDDEEITYTSITDNVLGGVARGTGGTTATVHRAGATVWEKQANYDSLLAGHQLHSVGDIYAQVEGELMRVISGVSAIYEYGRHLLRADSQIKIQTIEDDFQVTDTIDFGSSDTSKIILPNGVSGNMTIYGKGIDGDENTYDGGSGDGPSYPTDWVYEATFPSTDYGTIVRQSVWIVYATAGSGSGTSSVTGDGGRTWHTYLHPTAQSTGYSSSGTSRAVVPNNAFGSMDTPGNAIDGNENTWAGGNGGGPTYPSQWNLTIESPSTDYGTITRQFVWITYATAFGSGSSGTASVAGSDARTWGSLPPSTDKVRVRLELSAAGNWDEDIVITFSPESSSDWLTIYEVEREVEYTPTITESGDSVTNTVKTRLELSAAGNWDERVTITFPPAYDGDWIQIHDIYREVEYTPTLTKSGGASSLGTGFISTRDVERFHAVVKGYADLAWEKYGSSILSVGSDTEWDDTNISYPCIIKDGDTYKMWYSGYDGNKWEIGYATSSDGKTWTKHGSNPVLEVGVNSTDFDTNDVYRCCVIKDGDTYKMWYSGYDGVTLRIGYATSSDGISWTKYGSNPVLDVGGSGEWDEVHVHYPWVLKKSDGTYIMWYIGADGIYAVDSQLGVATSSDSISWTKEATNPCSSIPKYRVTVIFQDGIYKMWYSDSGDNKYATSEDGVDWDFYASNPVLSQCYHPCVIENDNLLEMWYFNNTNFFYAYSVTKGYNGIAGSYMTGDVVERPDLVIKHVLTHQLGYSIDDIDSTSFDASGSSFDASENAYVFAFRKGRTQPIKFIKRLAQECRSTLKYKAGLWYLDWIPDTAPTAVKTISKGELAGNFADFLFHKSSIEQLKNDLTAKFKRNYSGLFRAMSEWDGTSKVSDTTSITKYGTYPETIEFEFIRDQDMADSVLAHILLQKANPLLELEFKLLFEHFDIEAGDTVDIDNLLWDTKKFWVESISRKSRGVVYLICKEWWA